MKTSFFGFTGWSPGVREEHSGRETVLIHSGGRGAQGQPEAFHRANKNFYPGQNGRAENPVRNILNYAADRFLRHLPIVYVLTVVGRTADERLAVRGLFIGDDVECFHRAAALSLRVNFETMDALMQKAVVYLDPHEFRSTWLGNKAIYRTRMALATG